jgi:hypothetical protein
VIMHARLLFQDTVKALIELQMAHSALNSKLGAIQEEHSKSQYMQRLHDEDMLEKAEMIKEQKIAVSQLEKVMHDKNMEMSDTLVLAQQQKIDLANAAAEVHRLCEVIASKDANINQLSGLLEESSVQAQFNELNNQLAQASAHLLLFTQENESLKQQSCTMQDELTTKSDKDEEFNIIIKDLNQKLAELANTVEFVQTEKNDFKSKFIDLEKTTEMLRLEKDGQAVHDHELESKIEEQTQTLLMQSQATQCLEDEISSLRGQLSEHANSLLSREHDLVEHLQTIDQHVETIDALNSKIEILEDTCSSLQNQLNSGATELSKNVGQLTSDLQERETEIQSKMDENDILKQNINALQDELEASKILLSCASNEKMENEAIQASLHEKLKQEWDEETKQITEKLAAMRNKAKVCSIVRKGSLAPFGLMFSIIYFMLLGILEEGEGIGSTE